MAKRGHEAALKRAKERARQEKRAAKLERQQTRQTDLPEAGQVDEQALMEKFARLSELHANDQISTDQFNEERTRIFSELGIEPSVDE